MVMLTADAASRELALRNRLRADPADREAWHGLIALALEADQFEAVRALAERLRALGWHQDDGSTVAAIIYAFIRQNDWDAAAALANQFLNSVPDCIPVQAARGQIKLAKGDGPGAMADLAPAWHQRQDTGLVYAYALAARLADAKQDAAMAFAWAATQAQTYAPYHHAAGLFALEIEQYDDAIGWARRAAALDPQSEYVDLLAVATAARSLQRRTSFYRDH